MGPDGDLGQIPGYVREGDHPVFVFNTVQEGGEKKVERSNLRREGEAIRGDNLRFLALATTHLSCFAYCADNKADKQEAGGGGWREGEGLAASSVPICISIKNIRRGQWRHSQHPHVVVGDVILLHPRPLVELQVLHVFSHLLGGGATSEPMASKFKKINTYRVQRAASPARRPAPGPCRRPALQTIPWKGKNLKLRIKKTEDPA